jgi:anti-anti-sigma factor
MGFDVDVKHGENGAAVVALGGELDLGSAPQFEAAVRAAEREAPGVIVIDLRLLDFMDSTGLNSLLRADLRAQEGGRRLVVVRGNEQIQRLFSVAGLDDRLTFVDEPS